MQLFKPRPILNRQAECVMVRDLIARFRSRLSDAKREELKRLHDEKGFEAFCDLWLLYQGMQERCTENERAMIRERERADRAEAELQERERQR